MIAMAVLEWDADNEKITIKWLGKPDRISKLDFLGDLAQGRDGEPGEAERLYLLELRRPNL